MPRNKNKLCNRCNNVIVRNVRRNYNNDEGNDEEMIFREQLGGTMKYNTTINKRIEGIKNQGFVDSKKYEDYVRMILLNPRGFGPNNNEKVNMLKQAMIDYEIDAVLFSGTDRRWNESRVQTTKNIMKTVNKSMEIITSDSGEEP